MLNKSEREREVDLKSPRRYFKGPERKIREDAYG